MNKILDINMCITLMANALANELSDEELEFAGAVLTQFGDTLSTISIQRELYRGAENNTQAPNDSCRNGRKNPRQNGAGINGRGTVTAHGR